MDKLKELVREALKNAAENGYDFTGMDARAIAVDMLTYDAALEEADLDEVTRIVEELRK
jgi:hypothetical protein